MSTESPASDELGGVQIVFQLPYHVDESIDFDTLGLEIDHVFAAGADGLVMAMVTEVLRLTEAERHEVAGFTCQAAAGRGPVVVSVGAESTPALEQLMRRISNELRPEMLARVLAGNHGPAGEAAASWEVQDFVASFCAVFRVFTYEGVEIF